MNPLCERCRLSAHHGDCKPDTYMPARWRHIFSPDEIARGIVSGAAGETRSGSTPQGQEPDPEGDAPREEARQEEVRPAVVAPADQPVAYICILPTKDAGPTKFFTAPSDPRGFPVYRAAPVAPASPIAQAEPGGTVELIAECRDALAEELAAWDIDPPLHHVKQAHDKCVAWLADRSKA